MILRHVDQRAVGIGEVEAAVRAFRQQLQPRDALGIEIDRLRAQLQVLLLDLGEVLLEGVDARHPEADVIHRRLLDAGAVEGRNRPRQDRQRHAAVGEMIAVGLARHVARLEIEHVGIELRHLAGMARAQRKVADGVVLLPLALGIDLGAVLVALLREVEIVAGRIVRAE